jgi:hypothetical protein
MEACFFMEMAKSWSLIGLGCMPMVNPPSSPPPTPTSPTPSPSPTTIKVEAESYLWMQCVQTKNTSNWGGGINVGLIDTGDWMSHPEVTIPRTGAYRVEYQVSCGSSGGIVQLKP